MSIEKDVPIVRSKWLEIYFGLFGPCLTYHTNGYDDDNARFVISLILFKLYIRFPWKHHTKHKYDLYRSFGFYTANEPDRFIIEWGNFNKYWIFPWVRRIVKSNLIDVHGDEVDCEDVLTELDEAPFNYYKHRIIENIDLKYAIVKNTKRMRIFNNCKLFDINDYDVYVVFAKPFNGYDMMRFTTNDVICIEKQIELQLMIRDPMYNEF